MVALNGYVNGKKTVDPVPVTQVSKRVTLARGGVAILRRLGRHTEGHVLAHFGVDGGNPAHKGLVAEYLVRYAIVSVEGGIVTAADGEQVAVEHEDVIPGIGQLVSTEVYDALTDQDVIRIYRTAKGELTEAQVKNSESPPAPTAPSGEAGQAAAT